MRRATSARSRVVFLALAVLIASAGFAASVSATTPGASLAEVRAVTAAFHDVDAAATAGYERFLECFQMPGVGGMGQHYVDVAAIDTNVDALHPEAMVYEVRGDALKLVAVEYVVPKTEGSTPPNLFGHEFMPNDTLGIWALHAWIWRPNPLGTFEPFNPSVRLCQQS